MKLAGDFELKRQIGLGHLNNFTKNVIFKDSLRSTECHGTVATF